MASAWRETVLIGVVVGLVFSFGPLLLDYARMMRLVRYINLDIVRFQQLLATGDAGALAYPLSHKLAETGVLLSWKTQRSLTALRDACERAGAPLETGTYETLTGSLETYRVTVGMLSGRIGVLAWHACYESERPLPPLVAVAFRSITRDWREFAAQSAFLESFLKRHTDIRTGPAPLGGVHGDR